MKHSTGSVQRLAVPVRAIAQRFAFFLLLAAAVGLMVVGKAETVLVERVRSGVMDVVAPVMDALSRPAATVANSVDHVGSLIDLYEENNRLREQNARLLHWQAAAQKLAEENAELRRTLGAVPDSVADQISARVIADNGGVFVRSVMVNAGKSDGVRKGSAAMTGLGLTGRVTSVGDRSARVLLITDLNSRIPVVVEGARARAILAGDNSEQPKLIFASHTSGVAVGNRVVTSGHGGVFPPGIPVGRVVASDAKGIRVQPFSELHRLDFLRILDYAGTRATALQAKGDTDG